MAIIYMGKMGRGSPHGCPGSAEGSRLQDTHRLKPFTAEEAPLTALSALTRQVAIFFKESSLTWENVTLTNIVSCPRAGNHCTKYLLHLNPTLALYSLKENL